MYQLNLQDEVFGEEDGKTDADQSSNMTGLMLPCYELRSIDHELYSYNFLTLLNIFYYSIDSKWE